MIVVQKYLEVYKNTTNRVKKDKHNLKDCESFKAKILIPGNTPVDSSTKHAETILRLKYLNDFCRTLEMPLWSYFYVYMVISLCYY